MKKFSIQRTTGNTIKLQTIIWNKRINKKLLHLVDCFVVIGVAAVSSSYIPEFICLILFVNHGYGGGTLFLKTRNWLISLKIHRFYSVVIANVWMFVKYKIMESSWSMFLVLLGFAGFCCVLLCLFVGWLQWWFLQKYLSTSIWASITNSFTRKEIGLCVLVCVCLCVCFELEINYNNFGIICKFVCLNAKRLP